MAKAISAARQECTYEHNGWNCPFYAEYRHDLCIFHMSADQKVAADFWRHFATYLSLLFEFSDTAETTAFVAARRATHWVFREADSDLTLEYSTKGHGGQPWSFTGFVFPASDAAHGFGGIPFPEVDFTDAEFCAPADFRESVFTSEANFRGARFKNGADFEHATFNGATAFDDAKFTKAANFRRVESGKADFSFDGATFNGPVDFSYGTFRGRSWFPRVMFAEPAVFSHRSFEDEANFERATFRDEADFSSWKQGHPPTSFKGRTSFHSARFFADLSFEGAKFEGKETSFRDAKFFGQVLMRRTLVNGQLFLNYAHIRNQLFFDGSDLGDSCVVLLWGLNFDHGISDVMMEKDRPHGRALANDNSLQEERWSGRINAPAGQVVFRDIKDNMNHVSFLHTDILTDRLLVRFSNVKWDTNPKRFILDAKFAFVDHKDWSRQKLMEATGLPGWAVDHLPELYFADQPMAVDGTPQQREESEKLQLQSSERPVKQDVERIAREIRLSYEKYGHYGDAGDYYVAEMDFRRKRLPPEARLKRPAMWIYRFVSRYGESPTRAFVCLCVVWLASSLLYMFAGFSFGKVGTVRYALAFDKQFAWPALWRLGVNFLHALAFSFVSMVPGYFRFSAPAEWPTAFTPFIVVAEAVFGIGLLTLFLLAIRRRFRR